MTSKNEFALTYQEPLRLAPEELLGLIDGLKPYYSRDASVRLLSKKLDQALIQNAVVTFTPDELERIGLLVLQTLKAAPKRKGKS